MPNRGKRYAASARSYDKLAAYPADQALDLVKTFATAKFDETVDAVFRLGIDPRKADQLVRGTVSLPHGTGQEIRVAVFAPADRHKEAEEAGADLVGGKELAEEIAGGRTLDFDLVIATPDMMSEVGKLGRVLGPRGLMPNPKAGTVTPDLAKTIGEFKAGRIEYRNDRYGNVHVPIGKASFDMSQLLDNLLALTAEIVRQRPAAAKGKYMESVSVSSTMGPGVRVDVARLEDSAKAA
jgi:large subunit ribosomal protein L1